MNRLLFLLVFLPCLGFAQSPKMDSSINYHYNMDDYLKYIGETILFYRSPENLDKQQLYAGFYLTTPDTIAPLSLAEAKLLNGSPSSCLTPREIRSFSVSIARTTASISSPFL